jgi:hypothetical protein
MLRKFTRDLPAALSLQEISDRDAELIRALELREEKEADAKRVAKELKEEIEGLKARERQLRAVLKSRKENRPVECIEIFYSAAGQIVTIRLDTKQELNRRPIVADDRKQQLFALAPVDSKAEAAGESEDDRPVTQEEADEEHFVELLTLVDMLKAHGIVLTLGVADELTREQRTEAAKWVGLKEGGTSDEENPRPEWLEEFIDRSRSEGTRSEAQSLSELLSLAGESIEVGIVADWGEQQKVDAEAYAVALLEGRAEVPKRPDFFPSKDEEVTPESVLASLLLVEVRLDLETVAGWSPIQRDLAFDWSRAVQLSASDHDDVVVPEKPGFVVEAQTAREDELDSLAALLGDCDIRVPYSDDRMTGDEGDLNNWTREQRAQARAWCEAYYSASTKTEVAGLPPRPDFLPEPDKARGSDYALGRRTSKGKRGATPHAEGAASKRSSKKTGSKKKK